MMKRLLMLLLLFVLPHGHSFVMHGPHQRKSILAEGSNKKKTQTIFSINKSNEKPRNNKRNSLRSNPLRILFKGLSVPFPILRQLLLESDTTAIGVSFKEGFVAIGLYLSVGVLAFSILEPHWDMVTALYFATVCFSTVGYGDLCPSNNLSKLFTCLFGLVGIVGLGSIVANLGGQLVQMEQVALEQARRKSRRRIFKLFEGMNETVSKLRREEQVAPAKEDEAKLVLLEPTTVQNPTRSFAIRSYLGKATPTLLLLCLSGRIIGLLNKWSIVDSIYYSLVTATTIGFGDLAPATRLSRLLAVLWIPASVAAMGEFISAITLGNLQRRQRNVFTRTLERDMTIQHLTAMDANGDGQISRLEYVQFMLVEMGRTTTEELSELSRQFDRLDVCQSGYLDKEDLKLMAKLRRDSENA